MHLPHSFLTCCLCRDTELSHRVGFTPALLGTNGSVADQQREVVADALGDGQYVLEELGGNARLEICWGGRQSGTKPGDVTSLVKGKRGMEMCCLGMWLQYSAGNGSYWWSLSTFTALEPVKSESTVPTYSATYDHVIELHGFAL